MPNNVAASMTASIVIDKSDLLAQILKGLSEGQKELENNKLEMYFDFSDSKNKAEFEKTLQKYKKQLASSDFVVKITNEGIEETVKSLDKLLDVVKSITSGKGFGTGRGNGNGIGNSIIDENQLKTVIDLFTKMESNLASIKKIFVDVGDGEEFSPLLSMINKINSSISELSSSVKGIGLNMNIDVGSDTELEAKIQSKMSNALQAYQRLFEHIKMSGVGGSMVNTNFFEFDINQFDTMMAKIQAYRKFIENMRNQVKSEFGGKDLLYTETDKKYWTSATSAMGQLTKAQNEMNKSADANPLDDLFGKTDLTGVIEQLNLIVSKLDEISVTATKFSETFSQGLNITTSVEEISKLTEKVKEFEAELAKVKSVSTGKATTETVMYHAGVISKLNKAETNGRFYGSDRGTGYFGTGHYFVDSKTKHELDENSSYSSLPYTSIDISKYDNLFKATSDEIADRLHTFLKNLTKFTQGSDTFDVTELFLQFQKVFGETTMDMEEFDTKLSQLKAYMQSSNMSDRGDSVSTQFMKSLGYGGVDTRGTKYADTRYGTVIYDLKEESVLQANITDELQKQGQMLEKIDYEKGQVFDKSEDTRIQGILDQQAKAKEINTEFNKIFDSTNLNAYESELDSVNQKLSENQKIINNCRSAIENADEDARRFAKEMAELDLDMSDEEIAETANENKIEYQERIDELNKEQSLLEIRKQELELNLDAEYKLANAARERATATVEGRMKDAFQENATSSVESTNAIQKENNALAETAENAEKAATSKKKFSQANEKVKETADESVSSIKDEANAFSQAEWDKNVKAIQDYMNAVSKLNNLKASDKGTGRKSNQIEVQIKEVESLKDAAYEARQNLSSMINPHSVDIDTWENFVQVMKQFGQASLGSAESVAKLEDALQNVKTSIVNSVQSDIEKYNTKWKNLSATPADFNQSEKYKANLAELKEQISQFETFRDQIASKDTITEEDIQSIAKYKSNIEEATRAITSMTAAEKGSTSLSRDKLYNKIGDYMKKNSGLSKQFRVELQKLQKQLTMRGANANVSDLTDEFLKLQIRIREAGEEGKKFWDVVKEKAWYGAASQIGMAFGINDIIRYGQNAVSTITELDTALVDLKKTTSMSSSELENFYYDSNEVAKQMGVSTEEIINQASAWSRLGFSTKDASTEMAKLSAQFAAISPGMDLDTATDGLVSTMKAFNIDVEDAQREISDNINRIGNTAATSNDEIVDMLTRSSAAMSAANNTLEETIALETAAVEITRNAETTGTAFKTLAMRIRGYDEETEQLSEDLENISGDIADLTKTAKTPGGISLFSDKEKQTYKSTYQILKEISEIWDDLTDKDQAQLLEKLAGKRGGQVVAGLLSNFSAAEKAMKEMDQAAGSSDAEMSIIQESLEYKINALKETWVGTVQDILDRGDIGTIVDGLTKISEAIGFVTSNLGLLKTAALGVAGYLSFKNVGILELY